MLLGGSWEKFHQESTEHHWVTLYTEGQICLLLSLTEVTDILKIFLKSKHFK